MPWKIIYHENQPQNPKIGDMWPDKDRIGSSYISNKYLENCINIRPPLVVVLPSSYNKNGDIFLIDRAATDDPNKKGWDIIIIGQLVDGETPNISVYPSINCVGSYHGYIKNGIITDDCEGRNYEIA